MPDANPIRSSNATGMTMTSDESAQDMPELLTAPWLLSVSFLLLGAAMLEKALNVVDLSLPLVDVYPRQLLDWAIALAILEIALTLRQLAWRQA